MTFRSVAILLVLATFVLAPAITATAHHETGETRAFAASTNRDYQGEEYVEFGPVKASVDRDWFHMRSCPILMDDGCDFDLREPGQASVTVMSMDGDHVGFTWTAWTRYACEIPTGPYPYEPEQGTCDREVGNGRGAGHDVLDMDATTHWITVIPDTAVAGYVTVI